MENNEEKHNHSENDAPAPIENDYSHHKENPGVPVEAVVEKDENGAGKMLKWIIPIIVVVLFIAWLLIKE